MASFPTCRRVMRLPGLTNFDSIAVSLARLPSTVLAQEELQDAIWSVQRAEAKPRDCSDPALVAHIQTTTKVNMQILNRGSGDDRCLQGVSGERSHTKKPVLLRVACKEGQEQPHQHPGNGNSVDGLSKV